MEQIPGKGTGLVAAQPLKAGQIVLTESPLVLYSASPLFPAPSSSPFANCDHCFRILPPHTPNVPCPSCSHHLFCSHKCLSLSLKSSYSSWACKALVSLLKHPNSTLLKQQPPERQVQARFVVASHNLFLHSPSELHTLLSLHGTPDNAILDAAKVLHSLISPLFPPQFQLCVDLIAQLLAKDRLNSFCLMDPYSPDGPQRSIKAYSIYPKATFFNHDCVPNACSFDYVDTSELGDEHNTDIVVRLIEDVPEGKEVCISYFRIGRDYCTRKRILMEDYGFTCGCDRCKIEANWGGGENQGENSDLPHVRFLSKYVCERKNCAGTMAPLPPNDGAPSNVLECNFCGNLKIDCDTA
ncbi:Histone-lysine N-methyltransferase ASHR2 [Spatholobus suberectus]|nr:Histone-lysine N-methyltransferase ASHR2 [Spatholobus suberectus]